MLAVFTAVYWGAVIISASHRAGTALDTACGQAWPEGGGQAG